MLIDLTHSFFKQDPSINFCKSIDVNYENWNYCRKLFKFNRLGLSETHEIFNLKTKKNISRKTYERWMAKQDLYLSAQPFIRLGHIKKDSEFLDNKSSFNLKRLAEEIAGVQ